MVDLNGSDVFELCITKGYECVAYEDIIPIRLVHIDAPEPGSECYGDEAELELAGLLLEGMPVSVVTDPNLPEEDTDGILQGAQYRDLTNLIASDLNKIAEGFVGVIVDGKGLRLAEFGGAITGRLGALADAGALFARVNDDGELMDPGYVVDAGPSVNSPISLATGLLKAEVGIRLSPTAEMVSITVTAGDAAAGL